MQKIKTTPIVWHMIHPELECILGDCRNEATHTVHIRLDSAATIRLPVCKMCALRDVREIVGPRGLVQ